MKFSNDDISSLWQVLERMEVCEVSVLAICNF